MKVKEVTFSYNQTVEQLKAVSLAVEEGKITTIIGPNGCGKSTLLELMSGHYTPKKGQILLDGKAIQQYSPKELAKRLAVVHQKNDVPFDINVERLVAYGRMPYKRFLHSPSEEDEKWIDWALSITNLQTKRKRRLKSCQAGNGSVFGLQWHWRKRRPFYF